MWHLIWPGMVRTVGVNSLRFISWVRSIYYWGKPERAPHKREVRAVGLSVCRSVRTFMTRKYTRTVLIYGYLQLLIAAFKVGLVHWFVHQDSTNM